MKQRHSFNYVSPQNKHEFGVNLKTRYMAGGVQLYQSSRPLLSNDYSPQLQPPTIIHPLTHNQFIIIIIVNLCTIKRNRINTDELK